MLSQKIRYLPIRRKCTKRKNKNNCKLVYRCKIYKKNSGIEPFPFMVAIAKILLQNFWELQKCPVLINKIYDCRQKKSKSQCTERRMNSWTNKKIVTHWCSSAVVLIVVVISWEGGIEPPRRTSIRGIDHHSVPRSFPCEEDHQKTCEKNFDHFYTARWRLQLGSCPKNFVYIHLPKDGSLSKHWIR